MTQLQITAQGRHDLENKIITNPDIILALMDLQINKQPNKEMGAVLLKLKYANLVKY